MTAHSTQKDGEQTTDLPDIVPFDLAYLTRLSWELGTRVVDDEESTLRSRWEHAGSPWTLSVFEVTSNTVILCLRTPVGRERFYGTTRSEVQTATSRLDAAPYWTPTE